MSQKKIDKDLTSSMTSISSASSSTKQRGSISSVTEMKKKLQGLFGRDTSANHPVAQVVVCKRLAKAPMLFLTKRRQMRQITLESTSAVTVYDDTPSKEMSNCQDDPRTFDEYTTKLEEVLNILRNMKREDYESPVALKILRFLENLIHQPKEWISGAKLKLSEMRFPETAMTLMNSYKEKGYLVRRIVFVHSILLYNAMSNFTDHEFDKEGLIRKQSADAGFIEFACEILNDSSYRESLKKCYVIENPDEILQSDDFNNYQKILYICDSALTILYNMANLPELKIHFRECNAILIIAEYTKLPSDTVQIRFAATRENQDSIASLKELQDIVSAIRLTSCLLLPLIMNEDEDNLLAMNTADVLPLLSGMIKMYNQDDQRFYGFSFVELLDGLSKLMVRGRTHKYVDQNLVNRLLHILQQSNEETSIIECVSNAILNAAFDEKVQSLLDSDQAVEIIKSTASRCQSQLVQKNCEAILWTLNRIPHRSSSTISQSCQSQGHVMISYNRSVTAMCLKIRDRLKALHYKVWLDVDNINGGVLEAMAKAVEESSIVLICMNEQYKQSYYCRLEAEYATELRKPCIPCLMQPRFRPYGWLGIIKGAKIHVDFATLPFDEAFSLLIREVETIRKAPNNTTTEILTSHLPLPMTLSTADGTTKNENSILQWDKTEVKLWLDRCDLSHLEPIFVNMTGPLLCHLYQMKKSTVDGYLKFVNHFFARQSTFHMSDALKFDLELDKLFQ